MLIREHGAPCFVWLKRYNMGVNSMLSQDVRTLNGIGIPGSIAIPEQVKSPSYSKTIGKADWKAFHLIIRLAIICIPVVACYAFNGMNVQAEHTMQSVQQEVALLKQENSVMKLELAKLEAPARIQQVAETKLGMKVATSAIYGSGDFDKMNDK